MGENKNRNNTAADAIDLDPSILAELPAGSKILSISPHGKSFWAHTARMDILQQDGFTKSLFLKLLPGETGLAMVKSEYESLNAIRDVISRFAPRPIAYGTCQSSASEVLSSLSRREEAGKSKGNGSLSNPELSKSNDHQQLHFILTEFLPLLPVSGFSGDPASVIDNGRPPPEPFTACLRELHQKSVSPTGKFGFHIQTYAGNLPQYVEWTESWEDFFMKSLKFAITLEREVKGPYCGLDGEDADVHPKRIQSNGQAGLEREMEEYLLPRLYSKVVPRLLRPLESGGRKVKPSLVHGDLWWGNAGVVVGEKRCVVFDACCFYAHHEYEFGQWMPAQSGFDKRYLDAYYVGDEISEPTEDFEGRLDLYKLRFNAHVSALFPNDKRLRVQMISNIRDLVERYGQEDVPALD